MGTKMDEKPKWKNNIKWMKNSNGWTKLHNQELCANVNYNLFTTKRFVLTKTLHVHLQEVCSHWELKEYEVAHFNTISHRFLFEFSLSNLLHLKSFLPLEEKNYILFPISTWLTSSNFSTATIHLQLLHIYFTMAKWKSIGMVTPNTLNNWIHINLKHTR
jgi:hypothetical protein